MTGRPGLSARFRRPSPEDAAELVESVGALWPSASRIDVARTARGGSDDITMLVLPSLRQPVLLLPADSAHAAVALREHRGRMARPLRLLGRLHSRGLLRRLPVPRLVVRRASGGVADVVAGVVGPVGDVVVRLGRRRHNRAVVLRVLDRQGGTSAFVKLSGSDQGRGALEREYLGLCAVGERSVAGVHPPAPYAYLRWNGLDLLVLEPLVGPRTTNSATASDTAPPTDQMLALADPQPARPLAETAWASRFAGRLGGLGDATLRHRLGAAHVSLLATYGEVAVPPGSWHGDWVSWNMVNDGREVLLWDWEHYTDAALAGFDHLHFLAQELRMRVGTTPDVEDRWLDEAATALARTWGLGSRQREAVVLAYLLEVNLRFLLEREEDPRGTGMRRGWGLPMVERIAARAGSRPTGGQVADTGAATGDAGATHHMTGDRQ